MKKRIHSVTCESRTVKTYYDSELAEYVNRLYIKGVLYDPADYFTNDKSDAIDTAYLMCRDPLSLTPKTLNPNQGV